MTWRDFAFYRQNFLHDWERASIGAVREILDTSLTNERLLRLFAVACCRRGAEAVATELKLDSLWHYYLSRLEDLVDTKRTPGDDYDYLRAHGRLWLEISTATLAHEVNGRLVDAIHFAASSAVEPADFAAYAARIAGDWTDDTHTGVGATGWPTFAYTEKMVQARIAIAMLRPPVPVDPAWLTSDVIALARGIYDQRAFDRLPVLADAMQDAGCGDDNLLADCRDVRYKYRGYWLVDLLTGRR